MSDALKPGQRVLSSGFVGIVVRLYSEDGPRESARMYEVRLPGGLVCICGSDLVPINVNSAVDPK